MEKVLSDEEKMRRAIEILHRRNNNYRPEINTTRVSVEDKKDYKLFKKMILQIIICLLIYIIFYLITTTNYVFSAEVIKNTNQILNYDINFGEMYNNLVQFIKPKEDEKEQINSNNIILENTIIPTNEQVLENTLTIENNIVEGENVTTNNENKEKTEEDNTQPKEEEIAKTQMELDSEAAAKICNFKCPLKGTITSEFGEREATIKGMTTDHKGIDIAANSGTSIKAAMEGTVSVAEENSEYGKFIKIVNGDVMTVYAHCKKLKVKVGDKIKVGQAIATVGSTGNSTGPHLHFEIRNKNRYINPRLLIDF